MSSYEFSLPHETLLNIFRWLPYSTLACVCPLVCKEWNNVAKDNNFWRSLYVARWGSESGPLGEVVKSGEYANYFELAEASLPSPMGSTTSSSPWQIRYMSRLKHYRDWSFGNYSITCFSPVFGIEENYKLKLVALDFNKETRRVTAGDSRGTIFQWHEDGQFIRRVSIPQQYMPISLMTIRGNEIAIACQREPVVVIFRLDDNDSEPVSLSTFSMRVAAKEAGNVVSEITELRVTKYCVAIRQDRVPYLVVWNRKTRRFIRFEMRQRRDQKFGMVIKELTPKGGSEDPTMALIGIVYALPTQEDTTLKRNITMYLYTVNLDEMTTATQQQLRSVQMDYDSFPRTPDFDIWASPFSTHALIANNRMALSVDLMDSNEDLVLTCSSTEVVKAAAFLSRSTIMTVDHRGTVTFSSLNRDRDVFRLIDFQLAEEPIECLAVCDDDGGRASKILLGTNNDIILIDSLKHNRDLQLRRFQEKVISLSESGHSSLQDYYDAAVYIVDRLNQLREELMLIPMPTTVHELGTQIGERYSEELRRVKEISGFVMKKSMGLPSIHPIVECCVRQLEVLIGCEEWMCNTADSLFREQKSYMLYSTASKYCAENLDKVKGFEPTTSRLQFLETKLKEQSANALNEMLQPYLKLINETREWIEKTDEKEFGKIEEEEQEKGEENQKEDTSSLPVIEKPLRYWSKPSIVTAKQKLELLESKQAYLQDWISEHQQCKSSAEKVKEELLLRIQEAETTNFLESIKGMQDMFKEGYLAELFVIRDKLIEYKNSSAYLMLPPTPKDWIAAMLMKIEAIVLEREITHIIAEVYQIIEASCENLTPFRALQVYSRGQMIYDKYDTNLIWMGVGDVHVELGLTVSMLKETYQLSRSDMLPNEMHVNVYKALDAFGLAEERIKEIKERKRKGTFSEADALQLVGIKQEIESLSWHAEKYFAVWKAIRDLDKIEGEGRGKGEDADEDSNDDFDYYDYNSDGGDEESDANEEEETEDDEEY